MAPFFFPQLQYQLNCLGFQLNQIQIQTHDSRTKQILVTNSVTSDQFTYFSSSVNESTIAYVAFNHIVVTIPKCNTNSVYGMIFRLLGHFCGRQWHHCACLATQGDQVNFFQISSNHCGPTNRKFLARTPFHHRKKKKKKTTAGGDNQQRMIDEKRIADRRMHVCMHACIRTSNVFLFYLSSLCSARVPPPIRARFPVLCPSTHSLCSSLPPPSSPPH